MRKRSGQSVAMKSRWTKKDSSEVTYKIELRKKFLPENAKVLDLFCGMGTMYREVYKARATRYLGIDRYKIHDKDLCIRENNIHYVNENDIDDFNVFDLDDYGSPWKLLYLIIKKYNGPEAVFFITDGLLLNQKLSGNINKWVSATEKIPKGMNIPGLSR